MEYEDTERKARDWKEEVNTDLKFDAYRQKFIDMITKSESVGTVIQLE